MNMNWRKLSAAAGLMSALCVAAPAAAQTITLKMAHQWPQNEEDYVIATGVKFAQEVERRSNGQIKIQTFPAESLVKAGATHTALRNGTVDLSIYPYIYLVGAIPEMNLMALPGLWKTHDEAFKYHSTPTWNKLEAKLNAYGIKTLCWIQIATGIASSKKFIRLPSDLAGQKMRMSGKYSELVMQKAGASAATMPSSELYNAMQLGLVDGIITSSSSFAAYRLYEVVKYYVAPGQYSLYYTPEPIAISMKTWNKLSPEHQKILMEVGKSLEQFALDGAKAEDARVTKLFAEKGAKMQHFTLDDWNRWQAYFQEHAYPRFRQDMPAGSSGLLDESLAIYR